MPGFRWKPEEDALIRERGMLGSAGLRELLPNRTVPAIRERAIILGVSLKWYDASWAGSFAPRPAGLSSNGEAREIPLTRGQCATVDAAAFAWLSQWKWSLSRSDFGEYAVRRAPAHAGGRIIFMHRVVVDAPPEFEVDHVDRNKLNNCISNLRWATRAQNNINQIRPNRSTGFRGVVRYPGCISNPYGAKIRVDGAQRHLGVFPSAEEAALKYDEAARSLHGPFAVLNFPEASR